MKKIAIFCFVLFFLSAVNAQQLDPTFNNGYGYVAPTPMPAANDAEFFSRICLQDTGKILLLTDRGFDHGIKRYNADGSLDTSFGVNGALNNLHLPDNLYLPADDSSLQIATLIDLGTGKFMLAYFDFHYFFKRFNADGTPDSSFGFGGTKEVVLEPPNLFKCIAPKVTADNKIVFAGNTGYVDAQYPLDSYSYLRQMIVIKFDIEGNIDNSFNGTGRATFVEPYLPNHVVDFDLNDDKIVLLTEKHRTLTLHYDTGLPDTTISENGSFILPTGYLARNVLLLADGKILFSGTTTYQTITSVMHRWNADMTIDTSFGINGKVNIPVDTHSMKQQPDGKLVLMGSIMAASTSSESNHFALARYNLDGTLDNSVSPGYIHFDLGQYGMTDGGEELLIQDDGKYLVGGTYFWRLGSIYSRRKAVYVMRLVPGNLLQSEAFDSSSVGVYPNPFTDRIHLSYTANQVPTHIALYDLQGRMIIESKDFIDVNALEKEILLPGNLSKGNYLLRVTTQTGKTTIIKVIKD